jgi:TetR/AcrR family transcriptional regulator
MTTHTEHTPEDTTGASVPGADADAGAPAGAPGVRKRPKPGERRVQILQTLASMLEQPGAERITTAALAGRLDVSEAALYRHFASKAQMFEGLIEFIEQSVFTLVNQISEREAAGAIQAQKIMTVLLQFGEKNPGMTRVMVGDALVFENDRLLTRMNQFFEHADGRCERASLGADGVCRRATATLRPLGVQARADGVPGSCPAFDGPLIRFVSTPGRRALTFAQWRP